MSAKEHLNPEQFGKPLPLLSDAGKRHIAATSAVRGGFKSPEGLGRLSYGPPLALPNANELFEKLVPGTVPERHRKARYN